MFVSHKKYYNKYFQTSKLADIVLIDTAHILANFTDFHRLLTDKSLHYFYSEGTLSLYMYLFHLIEIEQAVW